MRHKLGHRKLNRTSLVSTLELGKTGALSGLFIMFLLIMSVVVIGFIVFVERAQRRLIIQYPKRQVGMKVFQGDSSHLPLKLNTLLLKKQ